MKRFLLPVLVALATSSQPTSAQLGGLVSSGVVQRGAKKALPGPGNVLLILADDVGVDGIGAYGVGGDLPHTPRLDQLAAGGVLFRNAWANPVCSPTRATIQTGRYSIRTGVGWIAEPAPTLTGLPLSEVTLPEMLDLGTGGAWAHAAFGKWHLGDGPDVGGVFAPNLAGYDHFEGTLGNVTDYYDWTKVENGVVTQETGTYALTDQVDSALDWIATAPEPWFCYVAFNSAHSPWHAPPPDLHSVDLSGAGDPEVDPRPYYKAMVEAMDTEIGRLLDGLGGTAGNTTVLFLGDNGTPAPVTVPPFVPKHAKGTGYEGGVRVPLIVAGPRVKVPGAECQALVGSTDVFATVAELAGVSLRKTLPDVRLDAISFLPFFASPGSPTRRQLLFAERFFPNGPTAGLPVGPEGGGPSCQPDVGFGGPGTATLSLCGPPLAVGNPALLMLTGGPPNASGMVLQSAMFKPTPLAGGMLTPLPIQAQTAVTTNPAGGFVAPFPMPGVGISLHFQAVLLDPTQPEGFAISNTVRADFLPWNTKSIRDTRYKLIDWMNGGPEELYDLDADPFEQDDLLDGPLTPEQSAAYAKLTAALADLTSAP